MYVELTTSELIVLPLGISRGTLAARETNTATINIRISPISLIPGNNSNPCPPPHIRQIPILHNRLFHPGTCRLLYKPPQIPLHFPHLSLLYSFMRYLTSIV